MCLQAAPGVETINFAERKTLDQLHDLVPNGPDCSIEAVGFHYAHSWTHKARTNADGMSMCACSRPPLRIAAARDLSEGTYIAYNASMCCTIMLHAMSVHCSTMLRN